MARNPLRPAQHSQQRIHSSQPILQCILLSWNCIRAHVEETSLEHASHFCISIWFLPLEKTPLRSMSHIETGLLPLLCNHFQLRSSNRSSLGAPPMEFRQLLGISWPKTVCNSGLLRWNFECPLRRQQLLFVLLFQRFRFRPWWSLKFGPNLPPGHSVLVYSSTKGTYQLPIWYDL